MRTRVKICGITRVEDALAAVEDGADALGFIFSAQSPRAVSPATARSIVARLPPFVGSVGVFVNTPVEVIRATIDASGIQIVQLHGNEPSDQALALGCPVIKVFRPAPGFQEEEAASFRGCTLMVDAYAAGKFGGTGATSDWSAATRLKPYGRVILSGGLNPQNVEDAIGSVHPYAVDVSSGVERSPGVKDHTSLREFIEAVRKADAMHARR